jgi:hypothetical protein
MVFANEGEPERFFHRLGHDVGYWLGLTDPAGPTYLFWSGFGGCIRDIIVVVLILRFFRYQQGNPWDRGQPPPGL